MKIALLLSSIAMSLLLSGDLLAYAETGHRVVGAMADDLLKGKPSEEKLKKLLGSVTLQRASTIPDELRGEDKTPGSFKLPENPQLQAEILAFHAATNPPDDKDLTQLPPSHHWFHYTDVPLQATSYAATHKGTSKWDIVHMIVYCTRVLEGKEKPDNDLKITPGVALVLLSHYVGDIHQPLHVASIYLDKQGNALDPNKDPAALEDRGGNDINFGAGNLHGYWDYDSVESCLSFKRRLAGKMADQYGAADLAADLEKKEPANWKIAAPTPPEGWAEKWADEILPVAREAHDRLKFLPQQEMGPDRGKSILRWTAIEAPHPKKDSYQIFASKIAEKELALAGFRLADLLDTVLAPK